MKTLINSSFEAEWLGSTLKKTITLKEKSSNETGSRFIVYSEENERIGEYSSLEQFSIVLKNEESRLRASSNSVQKEVGLWLNDINKEVKELID